MKEGLPGETLPASKPGATKEAHHRVARWSRPESKSSRRLVHLHRRISRHGHDVRCVVESMTGARHVHDTLEQLGCDVLIADAQKTKGLAPLACKTDRIDARVLAVLSEKLRVCGASLGVSDGT
jgi:transposase